MASYSAPVAQDPGQQQWQYRWESQAKQRNACPLPGWCCGMMMWKNPAPTTLILLANSKAAGAWWVPHVLLLAARWKARGAGHQSWSCNPPRILGRAQRKGPITFTCSPSLFPRLRCIFSIYLPITSRTFTSFTSAYPVVNTAYSLLSLSLFTLSSKKNWTQACCYQPEKGVQIYNTYSFIYEVWSCKQYMPRHHPT